MSVLKPPHNQKLFPGDVPRITKFRRAGVSPDHIAEIYEVSKRTLQKFCRLYKIPSKVLPNAGKLFPEDLPKIRNLVENGESYLKLSKRYEVSSTTFGAWCRKHEIFSLNPKKLTTDKKKLIVERYQFGFSIADICVELRSARETVLKVLKKEKVYDPAREYFVGMDGKISGLYQMGRSIAEISEELKLPVSFVRDRVDAEGISPLEGVSISRVQMRRQEFLFKRFSEFSEKILSEKILLMERWVCLDELSLYLGLSKEVLKDMCDKEFIPYSIFGGARRFKPSVVEKVLSKKGGE